MYAYWSKLYLFITNHILFNKISLNEGKHRVKSTCIKDGWMFYPMNVIKININNRTSVI